jgi:hypothetical protein
VLHQEVDEAAQMQSPPPLPPSPTGDVCASYLLADGRRSSKFGGRSGGGGRNRPWGASGGDENHPRLCACRKFAFASAALEICLRHWNCRTGHSSRAWPEGALKTGPCNNTTHLRKPNNQKLQGRCESRGAQPIKRAPCNPSGGMWVVWTLPNGCEPGPGMLLLARPFQVA